MGKLATETYYLAVMIDHRELMDWARNQLNGCLGIKKSSEIIQGINFGRILQSSKTFP